MAAQNISADKYFLRKQPVVLDPAQERHRRRYAADGHHTETVKKWEMCMNYWAE